ncbi:hypothetical protein ABT126_34125 [Streptomyces sp. NPDC002012]|uniref:hypothetical protein n=1 Tax=Streptomyces sp. NPDC002012 TaxID=3154532 RepID=UPI0033332D0E
MGEDILAGHLPQVVVAVRPAQQCRTGPGEVEPGRALLPGQTAEAAVMQNPNPALGLRCDAGGEAIQALGKPAFEGGFAVVQEIPI